MNGEVFLTGRQVTEKVTLGKSEIYKRIREGRFPQTIKLAKRRVVWRLSEIEQWMAEQIAADLKNSTHGGDSPRDKARARG